MTDLTRITTCSTFGRTTAATLLGGIALFAAAPAFAAGFYIQEQSARATGRADSGEIADTGADSLWWNPASIGGMTGGDVSINATEILPRATINDTGSLIVRPGQYPASVGGNPTTHNPIDNGLVPSGAIAHALTNQIAVGLAITAPYNFTTRYTTDSFARYDAETTRLRTIDLQPTVALHFDANGIGINLGGGVNVERSTASFGNALPNLSAALPDGQQVLYGHGWDVGYSLGARIEAGRLSLGASYKSSIKHHLKGDIAISGLLGPLAAENGTTVTSATFATPWQLGGSARYKLNSIFTLDAQVIRYGWSDFSAINLRQPLNTSIPENYRNTWDYAFGVDADVARGWTVRGGVQRDVSPVRDDERDARVPDSNRWTFATGVSHELFRNLTLDGAFNYLTLKSAAIDAPTEAYAGTPVATPVLMSGEVTSAHVFIFSLGGRLRF